MRQIYLRLYAEAGEEGLVLVEDPESVIEFAQDDQLCIDLGGHDMTFVLDETGLKSSDCCRSLREVIGSAVRMGKFCFSGPSGTPTRWVLVPHVRVGEAGLCPCSSSLVQNLGYGDMVQLWSGEVFLCKPEGMDHISRFWTPGLDCTPPQRSRWWEKD